MVKNTLAPRAADTGREALPPYLDGPTGPVWVGGDPAGGEALDQFAGEHPDAFDDQGRPAEGRPPDGRRHAPGQAPAASSSLAQLAGGIASPLTGLAGTLSNLIGGPARSLAALQAQREAEAPAE